MNQRTNLSLRMLGLAALTSFALAGAPRVASAAEVTIGYVNLQRAILEVGEGKRAKTKLKKEFDKKKKSIKGEEESLLKEREEIRKLASIKEPDAALRARVAAFEKKKFELQQKLMTEQKSLQATEQQALAGITKRMRKIIDEIGKSGKYTLILEISDARLLYAKPHLDLTNEVIRGYDKKHQ